MRIKQSKTEQLLWENALASHVAAIQVLTILKNHPDMIKYGDFWVNRKRELEDKYPVLKTPVA